MRCASPFVVRCAILAILIAGFLGVDFAVPLCFPGPRGPVMLGAMLLGSCTGQVNLIAVWAALAQGNIVVRLPWSLLLGTMMWYAIILGNRTEYLNMSIPLDAAILLGTLLLIGIVMAQIPLWIAGKVFGWQLLTRDAPIAPATEGPLQFNLQHMLLGTALFSIALAPLRTILPPGVPAWPHLDRELRVLFPAVVICNLVVTMPCIWGAMRRASKLMPLGVGWLLYCGVLTAIEFGALCAMLGPPGPSVARVALLFYIFNVSQCATVFGTLLLLRAMGFQLVRTSSIAQPDAAEEISVISPHTDVELDDV